jgi:hypothetical protein
MRAVGAIEEQAVGLRVEARERFHWVEAFNDEVVYFHAATITISGRKVKR